MTRLGIVFYCPDRHINYNINALNQRGVGGGITGRVRLAHALAGQGHTVSMVVNCPEHESLAGVMYVPLAKAASTETDILIACTSGDRQDIRPLDRMRLKSRSQVFMVDSVTPPTGFDSNTFDFVSAPSNFIREKVSKNWSIDRNKIVVIHRGVSSEFYPLPQLDSTTRNVFSIAYSGHPSKGLQYAVDVIRNLRRQSPEFMLHIFGGHQLWGSEPRSLAPEEGLVDEGLVGQAFLPQRLVDSSFCICLQTREEPFGLTIVEAMRAGCIVIASPVGAYPELIRHGFNGFLVPGDPADPAIQQRAADLILYLSRNPAYAAYIRRNAIATPFDWDTVAQTWAGHWNWWLSGKPQSALIPKGCSACGGPVLPLADGLHCVECGHYQRDFAPV